MKWLIKGNYHGSNEENSLVVNAPTNVIAYSWGAQRGLRNMQIDLLSSTDDPNVPSQRVECFPILFEEIPDNKTIAEASNSSVTKPGEIAMSMTDSIANMTANQTYEQWGGRWPTWEEFQIAQRQGKVSVNKTIATKFIHAHRVPSSFRITYGIVVPWLGLLIVPVVFVTALAGAISGWWILGAVMAAWFLIAVARSGHVEGILATAQKDEEFYTTLVQLGAFRFA